MKEHIPPVAEQREIEKVREALNESLSQTYNDLTSAPVNLPYRDCLKEVIAAAAALTDGGGTARTREATARAKLIVALERIASTES